MSSAIQSSSVLQSVLRRITESDEFKQMVAEVRAGMRVVSISALASPASRALAVAALQMETGKRLALVVEATRDLETWERDVCFWAGALRGAQNNEDNSCQILSLPSSESDPYAGASPHPETLERRALSLWHLVRGQGDIVLLTARALARRTVSPKQIERAGAFLKRDEDYAPELLVEQLLASGYTREDPVGAIGEFSLRGGIMDIWSPGHDAPVRLEFFGDTIDSIREFDPETQRSVAQLKSVEIAPMRELTVTADDFRNWAEVARKRWSDERFARALSDRTVFAEEGETFAGWEWLIPLVHKTEASVFDYLQDVVLVVDEPSMIENTLAKMYSTLAARHAETENADDLGLRPEELYLSVEELRAKVGEKQRMEFRALGRAAAAVDGSFALEAEQPSVQIGRESQTVSEPLFLFPVEEGGPEIELRSTTTRRYHGRVAELAKDVASAHETGAASTLFVMPSSGVAERIAEMLDEYHVGSRLFLAEENNPSTEEQMPEPQALITVGKLSNGFEIPGAGLIVHSTLR